MIQVATAKDEHEGKYTSTLAEHILLFDVSFCKNPNLYIFDVLYLQKLYKWTYLTVFFLSSICYRRTLDRCLEGMAFVTFQLYILICLQLAIE